MNGAAVGGLLPRKGRGNGRPNGPVRVDLAFTDRSIRHKNLKSNIGNKGSRFKLRYIFLKKYLQRRPGSAPDLVSGQQEKSGWVLVPFKSLLI